MTVTAAFLIIGNEILSGRTQDKNLAFVGEKLAAAGIRLREARVIPDDPVVIVETVRALSAAHDYVFTSGGIGPTHDDITADCVAEAFGLPIGENPEARRRLETHYAQTDMELNEARLRMARTPEGAMLIDNPVSAAPGFIVENVHVMAGVPRIMQAMLEGILPTLRAGRPVGSVTIRSGLAEGVAAARLGALAKDMPDIDFGSYPHWTNTGFSLSLVARGDDPEKLEQAARALETMIRELGAEAERVTDG